MGMTDAENANRGGGGKSPSGGGGKSPSGGGGGYSPQSERSPSRGPNNAPSGANRGGNSGSSRGGGSGYSPQSERAPSRGGSQAPGGAARGDGNSRSDPKGASASYSRSKSMADSVSRSLSDMASSVSRSLGLDRAAAALTDTVNKGAVNALNGATSKSVNLGGLSGNAKTIAERWASAGWTDTQIQAGLGRISVESDFNPNAKRKNDAGVGKHSIGIAQWNRDRLSNLQGYAAAKNADWQDVGVQADFVNHEIFGDPSVKGQFGYQSEKLAAKALRNAKTPEDAAVAMMHYERPQGYTAKNPTGGMHWDKTLNRTNQYAGLMGQAGDPTQVDAPGQGLGSMVASAIGGIFGGGQQAPSAQTAYVDPYVVTPNSRNKGKAAIESAAPGSGTINPAATEVAANDPRNRPREGVAKLEQQFKDGNILGALNTISDPVGLALGTIEDMWNQNGGLAGLKEDLAGIGTGDFKMTAGKSPLGSGHSGSNEGNRPNLKKKKPASVPVTTPPSEAPTPELAVIPVTRKPFEWSTLLAGTGPGIKTI